MLEQRAAVSYLLARGLLDPASVVDGEVIVLDASRRNANFKVIVPGGHSYLLKQGVGAERGATIANEAAAYRFLQTDTRAAALRRCYPRFYEYDPVEQLLVLELFPDAERLNDYQQSIGRPALTVAAALGAALAALHRSGTNLAPEEAARIPRCGHPWALSIHRPPLRIYHNISNADLEIIRLIQRYPDFGGRLEALAAAWQATVPVHFDLKADNLLVTRATGKRELKIVDLEGFGWGDPTWDLGSVLAEYLCLWLYSIPGGGDTPLSHLIELARFPLPKIQPAMLRFWQAYSATGIRREDAAHLLVKSVNYAAARLVQTAFEQEQRSAEPSGLSMYMLQLAFNILQRPHEAAVHLFGLSLDERIAA